MQPTGWDGLGWDGKEGAFVMGSKRDFVLLQHSRKKKETDKKGTQRTETREAENKEGWDGWDGWYVRERERRRE